MNDAFRANGSDEFGRAPHAEDGKINYRDFGHWADMADEAESAEEFEESVLQEQVEHLKKYVIKKTDIKGRGADYTDQDKTTIAIGTCSDEATQARRQILSSERK